MNVGVTERRDHAPAIEVDLSSLLIGRREVVPDVNDFTVILHQNAKCPIGVFTRNKIGIFKDLHSSPFPPDTVWQPAFFSTPASDLSRTGGIASAPSLSLYPQTNCNVNKIILL